jgi:hypothetical protein
MTLSSIISRISVKVLINPVAPCGILGRGEKCTNCLLFSGVWQKRKKISARYKEKCFSASLKESNTFNKLDFLKIDKKKERENQTEQDSAFMWIHVLQGRIKRRRKQTEKICLYFLLYNQCNMERRRKKKRDDGRGAKEKWRKKRKGENSSP